MFVIVGLLQLALFIGLTFNFPKQRDQILLLALILLWTVVLIGIVTLFFADKRIKYVSERTVIMVAVITWLFGYVTGIVIGG